MDLKQFDYRVIAPCVPYLGRSPDGRPKEIAIVSYPFEDTSYNYEEAVAVLRTFTDRWVIGGSRPILEPYMMALPEERGVRLTMRQLEHSGDADEFLAMLRAGGRPKKSKPKPQRGRPRQKSDD